MVLKESISSQKIDYNYVQHAPKGKIVEFGSQVAAFIGFEDNTVRIGTSGARGKKGNLIGEIILHLDVDEDDEMDTPFLCIQCIPLRNSNVHFLDIDGERVTRRDAIRIYNIILGEMLDATDFDDEEVTRKRLKKLFSQAAKKYHFRWE